MPLCLLLSSAGCYFFTCRQVNGQAVPSPRCPRCWWPSSPSPFKTPSIRHILTVGANGMGACKGCRLSCVTLTRHPADGQHSEMWGDHPVKQCLQSSLCQILPTSTMATRLPALQQQESHWQCLGEVETRQLQLGNLAQATASCSLAKTFIVLYLTEIVK
jgi:hypothetical protein